MRSSELRARLLQLEELVGDIKVFVYSDDSGHTVPNPFVVQEKTVNGGEEFIWL